jgi:hypothetical protein
MKLNDTCEQIELEIKNDNQFVDFIKGNSKGYYVFSADCIGFVIFHTINDKFEIYVAALELITDISTQTIGKFAKNVLDVVSAIRPSL